MTWPLEILSGSVRLVIGYYKHTRTQSNNDLTAESFFHVLSNHKYQRLLQYSIVSEPWISFVLFCHPKHMAFMLPTIDMCVEAKYSSTHALKIPSLWPKFSHIALLSARELGNSFCSGLYVFTKLKEGLEKSATSVTLLFVKMQHIPKSLYRKGTK
jgi:hypothetical protein